VGVGILTLEVSRSHSDTPRSVGLLRTSDRPVAETYVNNTQAQETDAHAPDEIRTARPLLFSNNPTIGCRIERET